MEPSRVFLTPLCRYLRLDRKILVIQTRYAHAYRGPFGLFSRGHGIRVSIKEAVVPARRIRAAFLAPLDRRYRHAPLSALCRTGGTYPVRDRRRILFFFAVDPPSACVFMAAGAEQKFSMLGAMRAIAQCHSNPLLYRAPGGDDRLRAFAGRDCRVESGSRSALPHGSLPRPGARPAFILFLLRSVLPPHALDVGGNGHCAGT